MLRRIIIINFKAGLRVEKGVEAGRLFINTYYANGSARFIPVTSVHCLPIIVSPASSDGTIATMLRKFGYHFSIRPSLWLSVAFILLSCPSNSTFELDLLRVYRRFLLSLLFFSPLFFFFMPSVSKIAANTFDICHFRFFIFFLFF